MTLPFYTEAARQVCPQTAGLDLSPSDPADLDQSLFLKERQLFRAPLTVLPESLQGPEARGC